MTLRVGDVLEKKRGGGTKRVKVHHIFASDRTGYTHRYAVLLPMAPRGSSSTVRLGEDGLPEGYRKAVKT